MYSIVGQTEIQGLDSYFMEQNFIYYDGSGWRMGMAIQVEQREGERGVCWVNKLIEGDRKKFTRGKEKRRKEKRVKLP